MILIFVATVAVTLICIISLVYSIKLLMLFKGGILSSVWVGVLFASAFLLICSIGTISSVVEGEEPLFEIGANFGIAIGLFYAGWRSQTFWTKQRPE